MTLADANPKMEQLDDELELLSIEGYWKSIGHLPPSPTPRGTPTLWRWRDVYPKLFDAAHTIDLNLGAERRSLRLCTPGLSWKTTTETLTAAIQMMLPGESANAHRHSPAALRFVIQGSGGGFTTVNGEQYGMRPADLILTPQRTWHDHGNSSQDPVIWLDVLDAPIVRWLNGVFSDTYHQPVQDVVPGNARFLYPGSDALQALRNLTASDPYDGITLPYPGKEGGGATMPTMQCALHRLPPGTQTKRHRHTWNTIYHVVEGSGETRIGEQTIAWEAHDTFSLPCWFAHDHRSTGAVDAILFTVTDEPIVRALQLDRAEDA